VALDGGQISGAAIDVFEQEPPVESGLVQHPGFSRPPRGGVDQ